MARLKVHAGDFDTHGQSVYIAGQFVMSKPGRFWGEKIPASALRTVEVASEETVTKLGGAAGWGLVGGALLGPAGLLAGLLHGGRKNEVTFVAEFQDGRRLLATTSAKAFREIRAAVFE